MTDVTRKHIAPRFVCLQYAAGASSVDLRLTAGGNDNGEGGRNFLIGGVPQICPLPTPPTPPTSPPPSPPPRQCVTSSRTYASCAADTYSWNPATSRYEAPSANRQICSNGKCQRLGWNCGGGHYGYTTTTCAECPAPPPPPSPSLPPSSPPSPLVPPLPPAPPSTPELALPTLDNYTRIYRDGDSVADLTSLTYRTDAIIRMTAKTNTTFELINFVPVDLEDVEIVMSFYGGPQNVSVGRIDSLPAHAVFELEFPFVTFPDREFTDQDGVAVDLANYGSGIPIAHGGVRAGQECWSNSAARCRDDGDTPCDWCGGSDWFCCSATWSYTSSDNCHRDNVVFYSAEGNHRCAKKGVHLSFDYRGTSTTMQRLERLKSVPWSLSLKDFDWSNDPSNNWREDPEPRHARLWTALILNVAFMYSHPDFADRMAAEEITDNQGALMTAEKKRSVLSELLSPRRFNLGVVAKVSGLGGGSTLGVAEYVLKSDFFYGQQRGGVTYHELGHCLGYNHDSSMTYPTNGAGFSKLGETFGREMSAAGDVLIDQTNYAFADYTVQ